MTQDEVARALGTKSRSELLTLLDGGAKIVAPRGSLKIVGETWDAMRVEFDLVQVRRDVDFVIGCRNSFTVDELAPDLRFADMANTYDDAALPIACPRCEVQHARMMAESTKGLADLRTGRKQIAVLVGIAAVVMIGLSIRLAVVPAASLLLLLVGLWASGMAWLQFGDLRQEEIGHQPIWSIRRSLVAQWLPLHWFGPDHK